MNTIVLTLLLALFSPTSQETYKTVLRDEIAMEYMEQVNLRNKQRWFQQIAEDAYKFADEMLKAREKSNE